MAAANLRCSSPSTGRGWRLHSVPAGERLRPPQSTYQRRGGCFKHWTTLTHCCLVRHLRLAVPQGPGVLSIRHGSSDSIHAAS
jgi:hypothetical protein